MDMRQMLATIATSDAMDWQILFRPTYRHRITEILNAEGARDRLQVDEHLVAFCYRPDVAVTMAYGLVDQSSFELPAGNPFATENARSVYLDIFHEGGLVHRETILKVDRQRCLLPLPKEWSTPIAVPVTQYSLVRLIHALAGPPTDYETYFKDAGMVRADTPWP
ncbi:MAG: hypothetical protein HQ481_15615 [Alphaproteobacteria bacterium]|nr:hypothetical protein [Alphaproteobacteria bacterium]